MPVEETDLPPSERRYLRAYQQAGKRFLKRAAKVGLAKPHLDGESRALPFEEGRTSVSYTPDMAAEIDSEVDDIIAIVGMQNERVIRQVYEIMKERQKQEVEKEAAMLLGSIAGYMIKSIGKQIMPRIHGMLHAVPRLAGANGFPSLRASARATGVSTTWICKERDNWCTILSLPVPEEGKKSEEAKEKYSENGKNNHWRKQLFKAK